ncbi:hypothetical protein BH24ACT26_BH24ACT26_02670 [soil metagenome]
MTTALVLFTVVEIIVVVAVLASYMILITKHLTTVSRYLGKVAFGVRAVETQTGSIGPSVLRINKTLQEIEAALGPIAEKAERAAAGR